MEIAIPPGHPVPETDQDSNANTGNITKNLPSPPLNPEEQNMAPYHDNQNQAPAVRPTIMAAETFGVQSSGASRRELPPQSKSSPATFPRILPPPPLPPMSTSERKIWQLTRHKPQYGPMTPSSIFDFSDSSSFGSNYSQPEPRAKDKQKGKVRFGIRDKRLSNPEPQIVGTTYLKSATYNTIDKDIAPAALPKKARKMAAMSEMLKDPRISVNRIFSTEHVTMKQMLGEISSRYSDNPYSEGINDPKMKELVSKPLAIRSKGKEADKSGNEKSSIFANARVSMHWGIDAITSPNKCKHPAIPGNMSLPPTNTSPTSPHKKNDSSGKKPAKSPSSSPTSTRPEGFEPAKFSRHFSRTMKRLPGGKKPPKPTVITNASRNSNGPDTPVPETSRSSFRALSPLQHSNEHLQEVYLRAKKSLRIRNAEEKRREDIKKKIVVVGVSDQSPGELTFSF